MTTKANELAASVHDRMPAILSPLGVMDWLNRDEIENPPVELLAPFPADLMTVSEANPRLGNWRNQGPDMLDSA